MTKIVIPILFAVGTALFWGCYGPTIGNAQAPRIDGKPLWSPFKPYVFIGVAYLVIGIVGGLIMMRVKGDSMSYWGEHSRPAIWGFLAGTLGAFGALCLTSAMMYSRGNALLVMPIVFGGAVTVTALVSLYRLGERGSNFLWAGIAITAIGVMLTAMNTPHGHAKAKGDHDKTEQHGDLSDETSDKAESDGSASDSPEATGDDSSENG